MSSSVALLFRSLFAVRGGLGVAAIAMVLAGCSGSHSEPPGGGDGSGPSDAPTVALSVIDQATGLVKNTISSTSPSVARAVVKDGSGQAVENAVVRFASSDSAAVVFSPAATGLTDSNGTASVTVAPASLSTAGAYTLTASTQIGTQSAQGSYNVAVGATQVGLGALVAEVSPLSAYGTTVMSVPVTGVSTSTQVAVRFSSTCAAQNPPRATITPLVTSVNGLARATYVDMGCGTTDLVTATVEGTSVTQTANLVVQLPAIANIQFVSASPNVIALRGTGGVQGPGSGVAFPEISTVIFRVVDQAGTPVPTPTNVSLRLSNDTGGMLIDGVAGPVTKQTNAQGEVQVQVQSGTIPTPLWVVASIVTGPTTLTTNSVQLAVSTGQPIQSRFSFSAVPYNIEGWSYDGETSKVTIIAGDAMGNPVPDGTPISFVAENGVVEANCQTGVSAERPLPGPGDPPGTCSVMVTSQGVRPAGGRLQVVAYAVGEEFYEDLNSNNLYDIGEPFFDQGYLFLDRTESGTYEAPERIIPYLTAQSAACGPNPLTSSVPNSCDGVWGRAHVRAQATFVFSGSFGYFRSSPVFSIPNISNIPTAYTLGPSCTARVNFWLQDLHGNPMPYETTVQLDVSAGRNLKLVPNEAQKVENTSAVGGTFHSFAITGFNPDTEACDGSGPVLVRVITPNGNKTDLFVTITP